VPPGGILGQQGRVRSALLTAAERRSVGQHGGIAIAILDFEFDFARDVIAVIDARLARVDLAPEGDADGSFDRANYMAGGTAQSP
jgi:hypothetical protein